MATLGDGSGEDVVDVSQLGSPPEIQEGLMFADRTACTAFVQDLALKQGKRAMVNTKKSGGRNISYRYSSSTPCSFKVIAYLSRKEGVTEFFISSYELAHNGCIGSAKVTRRQVTQLAIAQHAVSANPKIPAAHLQKQIKAATSLAIPTRMMYRARDQITAASVGDFESEFKLLPSLLREFCRLNPSSRYSFRTDSNGRFRRAFVSHPFVASTKSTDKRYWGSTVPL
jgi:hypothetical protein